jgi:hypothetical protein
LLSRKGQVSGSGTFTGSVVITNTETAVKFQCGPSDPYQLQGGRIFAGDQLMPG